MEYETLTFTYSIVMEPDVQLHPDIKKKIARKMEEKINRQRLELFGINSAIYCTERACHAPPVASISDFA